MCRCMIRMERKLVFIIPVPSFYNNLFRKRKEISRPVISLFVDDYSLKMMKKKKKTMRKGMEREKMRGVHLQ